MGAPPAAEPDPDPSSGAPTKPPSDPASSTGLGGLGWNLLSAVLPLVGSFVVSLLLIPHLGPHRFGLYTTTMSAATLMLIVAKFGAHMATGRLVAEHPGHERPWIVAGLQLRAWFTFPMAVLCALTAGPLARVLSGDDLVDPLRLAAPVLVASSFYEMGNDAMVGMRQFRALMASRLASLALRIAAVFWVRMATLGTSAFLAGHAASQLLPALVVLPWLLRIAGPAEDDSLPGDGALRRTFQISLPLAFSSASFLVYAHTDRLMLAWFRDQATVGQFGAARNILDASMFPLFALGWSLRPSLVRAVRSGDRSHLESALAWGLRGSWLFTACAPALLFAFGIPLTLALYGEDYVPAARLLVWMLPVLALRGLGTILLPALLAADEQAAYARLMLWTAAVNVAANLLLIPRFGAEGAVAGTILSLVPLTVGGLFRVRASLDTLPWRRDLGSHARALAAAGVVLLTAPLWEVDTAGLTKLVLGASVSTALALAIYAGPDLPRLARRR